LAEEKKEEKKKNKSIWKAGEVPTDYGLAAVNTETNEVLDQFGLLISIKNDLEDLKKLL